MTRFRIGIALLLILLLAGIAAQLAMAAIHAPITRDLKAAGTEAAAGSWDSAGSYVRSAETRWRENWPVIAGLADHEPMEDIDALLAQLEAAAARQDTTEFTVLCAELSRRTKAMADAHRLTLWNLL